MTSCAPGPPRTAARLRRRPLAPRALAPRPLTHRPLTHRQLTLGRNFGVEEALVLEYRLTQHMMEHPDFFEGVRAVLVDKDQSPRWNPPSLAEVSEESVASYFVPIGDNELTFIE